MLWKGYEKMLWKGKGPFNEKVQVVHKSGGQPNFPPDRGGVDQIVHPLSEEVDQILHHQGG